MKKTLRHFFTTLITIFFISTAYSIENTHSSAITYEFNGGRFGDNLLSYIRCKYFSWKYNLSLLYRQFIYSDQLQLHVHEKNIASQSVSRHYKGIKPIEEYVSTTADPLLYVTKFDSKTTDWEDSNELFIFLLQHPTLYTEIKKMVAPVKKISRSLPSDIITIAVHVRKGGGFDLPLLTGSGINDLVDKNEYADGRFPLKFPPDSFYINAIRFLSEQLQDRPLYVYIFTDDIQPQAVVKRYQQAVNKPNIIFDYYRVYEPFNYHLVEDLFFMKEFDCLIRPDSSLSTVAQIIGNHTITIYPVKYHWQDNTLSINHVAYLEKTDTQLVQKLLPL